MRVGLSNGAKADLAEIGDYIAEDHPRRAAWFVRELTSSAREIGRNPLAFPFAEGLESLEVRRRVHGSYVILFSVENGMVSVHRVVHGARDYAKLFSV